MVKSKTDLNASTISTIVNIKISIGILQGFVCLFDVRGPPKNGIRDSPSSISLKRLPPHKIFYNPLSQFILATESRCFTELWDGQLGAQRKGETKRWDFTDFCVLLCSVLVVAGEGTACFLAVSDAQAKPRLSTRLQSNPDPEVWDQDLYALSLPTTASAPHSHRKDKPADPPVYVDTQTDPKNSTDVHNMTALGVE